MFCEQCGKQITEGDKFCGFCGWHVPEEIAKEEVTKTAALEEAVVPAVPVVIPAEAKKKKGKALPVIIGVVAVLVIVAVALIIFLPGVFRRNFSSPEKYFQYVAKQYVKEKSANMASAYNDVLNVIDFVDKDISVDVAWEIDKNITEMISMAAGADMSFLENGKLGVDFSVGKELIGAGADVALNDVEIGSAELIIDILDDNLYLAIPDFMNKYLGMEMEEYGMEIDEDMFEVLEDVIELLPDATVIESLTNKYYGIVIDCIEDVEKDKDTIKAEGVSQDVIALTVTVDEDTLYAVVEAVSEEMLQDKELKTLIMNVAELVEEDPDDCYDIFVDAIEELQDELDGSLDMEEDVEFVLYVNNSDEICGFEMEIGSEAISYVMPKSGDKFGFEASIDSYEGEFALVGNGKIAGNKLTGEFAIEADGVSYVDIAVKDLDTKKADAGQISGEFTFTLPSNVINLLAMETDSVLPDLERYALKLVVDGNSTSETLKLALTEDKKTLVAVEMTAVISGQGSIKVPADKNVVWMDDEEALLEAILDCDWNKLLDRLEDAELPSVITNELEDMIESLEYMAEYY